MRLLPAIILAVAIVLAPLMWIFLPRFLVTQGILVPSISTGGEGATLNNMVLEMVRLEDLIFDLQKQQERTQAEMQAMNEDLRAAIRTAAANTGRSTVNPGATSDQTAGTGTMEMSQYTQVVNVLERTEYNKPLSIAYQRDLLALFGPPSNSIGTDCGRVTNPKLKALLKTRSVGPIKVTMLEPALESLGRVVENIRKSDPVLYENLGTAGALCVRKIRGSSSISNHSFGTAIDLKINGLLDQFTGGKTQLGLVLIADFFKQEGWIWGAGFGREDSMHFEVSRDKLKEWRKEGRI